MEILEEFSAFSSPWVSAEFLQLWVLLLSALQILCIKVSELSKTKVLSQRWIENRELGDAVSEAKTFLDGEEGDITLFITDSEAVFMKSFSQIFKSFTSLPVLIVAGIRISIKSLFHRYLKSK